MITRDDHYTEIIARDLVNWWGINGPPEGTKSKELWDHYVRPEHIDAAKKANDDIDKMWDNFLSRCQQ